MAKKASFPRSFLSAEWRYLLLLNYEVDPDVLRPYLPAGTETELWDGRAIASVVGFLFLKTRLLGLPIPFHRNFEEVNLRFYVRPSSTASVRHPGERLPGDHGVAFVREIVPKPWVARIARWVYREPYSAMRMRHTVEVGSSGGMRREGLVEYAWNGPTGGGKKRLARLGGLASGDPRVPEPDSEAYVLTNQAWGYTRLGTRATGVYRVEHPVWRVWEVDQPYLLCDVAAMYGKEFEPFLRRRPRSAFLAEGSAVCVYRREVFHLDGDRQGSQE